LEEEEDAGFTAGLLASSESLTLELEKMLPIERCPKL
jgi:hypothetical protein